MVEGSVTNNFYYGAEAGPEHANVVSYPDEGKDEPEFDCPTEDMDSKSEDKIEEPRGVAIMVLTNLALNSPHDGVRLSAAQVLLDVSREKA